MTHDVTVDRVSEELATDYGHAAGDGERHGPLVEQLEGEVVNGDLTDGDNTKFIKYHLQVTPPIPRTASVALLIRPTVAAISDDNHLKRFMQ